MEISSYDEYQEKIKIWEDFENRIFRGGQYISVNPRACHNDLIDNYMCLFPKRALIETSALLSYIDMTPYIRRYL